MNEYLRLEQANVGNPDIQIALVSAGSVGDLRAAYPNYYFDSLIFVALLREMRVIPPKAKQK